MIQPGLERIALLLKNVHFPWKAIHVAGTNGKGSICAYASALLTRSNIRCGKFTSPHLIHRWDCISINDSPVSEAQFRKVENQFIQLNEKYKINASEFELLTATAFQLFNDANIDIGVVEVGMGGRLDSTNILNNQAVCIISKIARDHQSFLGNTLEEIAKHKAGILRPNIPFAVNSMNEINVHEVINEYAREVGASPRLSSDSPEVKGNLLPSNDWQSFAADLQPFQRENAILAYIGVVEALKSLGENTDKVKTLLPGIKNQKILGRFQQSTVFPVFGTGERQITVDGAHNPDAAEALAEFVLRNERTKPRPNKPAPQGGWPVTWVFAMTEGRDPRQYFHHLLRPGDTVITTSFGLVDGMPWVKSMDPEELLNTAVDVEPSIRGASVPTRGALRALCTAKYFTEQNLPIVLTGSLYLVGEFYREMEEVDRLCSTSEEKIASLAEIDTEERKRVDESKKQGEKIL